MRGATRLIGAVILTTVIALLCRGLLTATIINTFSGAPPNMMIDVHLPYAILACSSGAVMARGFGHTRASKWLISWLTAMLVACGQRSVVELGGGLSLSWESWVLFVGPWSLAFGVGSLSTAWLLTPNQFMCSVAPDPTTD